MRQTGGGYPAGIAGTVSQPAEPNDIAAVRSRLPGQGLSLAEAAWCAGMMTVEVVHDRPCMGTDLVLAGARGVDPEHQRKET